MCSGAKTGAEESVRWLFDVNDGDRIRVDAGLVCNVNTEECGRPLSLMALHRYRCEIVHLETDYFRDIFLVTDAILLW